MSALDVGLINALKQDSQLTTLAPGGVYRDVAPEAVVSAALNSSGQVFGIVTLQSAPQLYAFEARAFEDCLYLVKFVSPSTSPIGAQAASDRAETVLATLTVTGFAVTCSRREERISYVEPDGPVYWQHRGVSWRVVASPS